MLSTEVEKIAEPRSALTTKPSIWELADTSPEASESVSHRGEILMSLIYLQ